MSCSGGPRSGEAGRLTQGCCWTVHPTIPASSDGARPAPCPGAAATARHQADPQVIPTTIVRQPTAGVPIGAQQPCELLSATAVCDSPVVSAAIWGSIQGTGTEHCSRVAFIPCR